MSAPLVSFRDVDLGYGRRVVLRDLRLDLREGDYLGLVGPNGAGKTTVLRALVGNLAPLRGEVAYRGGSGRSALRFGYVPQREGIDEVFPLTVADVVIMGRYPRIGLVRRPGRADREFALGCLERVGLADLATSPFRDLSGGQKQRTLMARALAGEPEVLLLDEPTTGMDLASEEDTMALVDALHAQGMTVVLVTHLLDLVAHHARSVAILHQGLTVGPVDEVLTEARLSALYGRPVRVREVEGRRLVLGAAGAEAKS